MQLLSIIYQRTLSITKKHKIITEYITDRPKISMFSACVVYRELHPGLVKICGRGMGSGAGRFQVHVGKPSCGEDLKICLFRFEPSVMKYGGFCSIMKDY